MCGQWCDEATLSNDRIIMMHQSRKLFGVSRLSVHDRQQVTFGTRQDNLDTQYHHEVAVF